MDYISKKYISMQNNIIVEYMENFFGYGNLVSPYWFIGKEEGGGKTIEENIKRIETWSESGKTTTVDIIDYHRKLGFTDKNLHQLQPTWVKIAQVLQILEHDAVESESMREYLFSRFGRIHGSNALLELMPLASRSTSYWKYAKLTDIPDLADRKVYMQTVAPKRIARLKTFTETYNPKLVLFYSSSPDYIDYWSQIVGDNKWTWIPLIPKHKTGYTKKNGILFFITPHPTGFGINKAAFENVGHTIKKLLSS